MVSIPEDSPQHVKDEVLWGYRVGTQICFEGESMKKKKNRLQFNIKESDKILIMLAAFDRNLSMSVLKKQVRHLRSSGLLTMPMPTIVEGGEDGRENNDLQDADPRVPKNFTHEDDLAYPFDANCESGDFTDDSRLPLNGLVLVDDDERDDISTITDRGSMIPTEIQKRRAIIVHMVDDELHASSLEPHDRAKAKEVIMEAAVSLPLDQVSQAACSGDGLLQALPHLDQMTVYRIASRLMSAECSTK